MSTITHANDNPGPEQDIRGQANEEIHSFFVSAAMQDEGLSPHRTSSLLASSSLFFRLYWLPTMFFGAYSTATNIFRMPSVFLLRHTLPIPLRHHQIQSISSAHDDEAKFSSRKAIGETRRTRQKLLKRSPVQIKKPKPDGGDSNNSGQKKS